MKLKAYTVNCNQHYLANGIYGTSDGVHYMPLIYFRKPKYMSNKMFAELCSKLRLVISIDHELED